MRRSTRSAAVAQEALQKATIVVTAALNVPEPRAKRAKKSQPSSTAKKDTSASSGGGVPPAGISRYYEKQQWDKGYKLVAGVDEAGRGPLAGPVVAAACIIPPSVHIPGIDDSKKLKAEEREALFKLITSHPEIIWAVEAVDRATIDEMNILQATMLAMEKSVSGLKSSPDYVLVDGNRLPNKLNPDTSKAITKGDAKVVCIAAASIIAKVTRDRMMVDLHEEYPQYDFATHMGYGTPGHVAAIRKHGPCPAHRHSFNPVKSWFYSEDKEAEEGEDEDDAADAVKETKKTKKKAKKT